jgi:hypothetical protein
MKRTVLISVLSLVAASLLADDADDVKAAAKKLAEQSNYSWKTTVAVPEGTGGNFRPRPTDGKTEKGGMTWISAVRGDNTILAVLQGEKGAIKWEGEWKTLAELSDDSQQGPARFTARMLKNYKAPADEVESLVTMVKEVKKDGDPYSGDLTKEGAKSLLSFRGRAGGQGGPTVNNGKGTAKFWLKDGQLSKYEYHVEGSINFNGEDREINRTTTTEIKDVGKTKLEVPEEAKKKLS